MGSATWQGTSSDLLAMQVADPSRQHALGWLLPCVVQGADVTTGMQVWFQGCCRGKCRRGCSWANPLGWEGLVSSSLGYWWC